MKQDGSLGPQNPIMPQLTIGRTQGDLRFSTDANMAPLNARVFVQEGQLFIEDLSEGREKVFVRLTGGHTLQMGDIVIMGQQVFCFREKVGAMSAVTMLGATLNDIRNALDDSVAELVCIDPQGRSSGQFPISWVETQFGRTHGRYTFPNDRMMSGNHARILQRGEDFLLEDAGSRNGTLVSVRTKTALVDGSTVLVGSQLFRIQS
jgi:predicted component of type VI protein secretion system